jgi:hypothetical protein
MFPYNLIISVVKNISELVSCRLHETKISPSLSFGCKSRQALKVKFTLEQAVKATLLIYENKLFRILGSAGRNEGEWEILHHENVTAFMLHTSVR